jgi:HPt (histidine-containing phosphotransfer) domain-containing protein
VTDLVDNIGDQPSDEMSEYLQMFMDETEEQLEDLVEVLLVLEREPDSVDELNEAFRLIHSIKGSSGMMGFDNITMLTHHLDANACSVFGQTRRSEARRCCSRSWHRQLKGSGNLRVRRPPPNQPRRRQRGQKPRSSPRTRPKPPP